MREHVTDGLDPHNTTVTSQIMKNSLESLRNHGAYKGKIPQGNVTSLFLSTDFLFHYFWYLKLEELSRQ